MRQGTSKFETISKHRRSVAAATVLLIAAGIGAFTYSQMPPSYAPVPKTFSKGRHGFECAGSVAEGGPTYSRANIISKLPPGFAFGLSPDAMTSRMKAIGSAPIDKGGTHFTIPTRYPWLSEFSRSIGRKPTELTVRYTTASTWSGRHVFQILISFEQPRIGFSNTSLMIAQLGTPTSAAYSRTCDPRIDDASYVSAREETPQFGLVASECAPPFGGCLMTRSVESCALRPKDPRQIIMNIRSGNLEFFSLDVAGVPDVQAESGPNPAHRQCLGAADPFSH